ncbi:hypothetical protein [Runella sp.]
MTLLMLYQYFVMKEAEFVGKAKKFESKMSFYVNFEGINSMSTH